MNVSRTFSPYNDDGIAPFLWLNSAFIGPRFTVSRGMSIARTAPESFELQDLICIELIFRFGIESIDIFLVEPKGGEDGALRTRSPGPLLYEIQAKAGATMVTLADLALWLTHFP